MQCKVTDIPESGNTSEGNTAAWKKPGKPLFPQWPEGRESMREDLVRKPVAKLRIIIRPGFQMFSWMFNPQISACICILNRYYLDDPLLWGFLGEVEGGLQSPEMIFVTARLALKIRHSVRKFNFSIHRMIHIFATQESIWWIVPLCILKAHLYPKK